MLAPIGKASRSRSTGWLPARRLCSSARRSPWGIFEEIEGFAQRAGLVYARWSGGASGSFGPERVVFSGAGAPEHFSASDDDEVMLSASDIRQLGSRAAILASLERAELVIPPLSVRG